MSAAGVAQVLVWIVELYAALGAAVALAFAARGVTRIDRSRRGVTFGARLVLMPAAMVLWPLIVRRWIVGGRGA